MERLTFKTDLGISIDKNEDCPTCSICWNCNIKVKDCKYFKNAIEKLAKYEELEDQGLLLELPYYPITEPVLIKKEVEKALLIIPIDIIDIDELKSIN